MLLLGRNCGGPQVIADLALSAERRYSDLHLLIVAERISGLLYLASWMVIAKGLTRALN